MKIFKQNKKAHFFVFSLFLLNNNKNSNKQSKIKITNQFNISSII
jgi:hypothetical protein